MPRGILTSVVIAAALALAAPASSAGAVTVGVGLPATNGGFVGAGDGATFVQTALPGGTNASPLDGVVVRFRVQYGDWGDVRLRILRRAGGTQFAAAESSATESVGTDFDSLLRTFSTRLAIRQGDQIGIDATNLARNTSGIAGATRAFWFPVLGDGGPPSTPTNGVPGSGFAYTFNADVEPDGDGDGFGDETQDQCVSQVGAQAQPCNGFTIKRLKSVKKGKVKVVVSVPGAGTLVARGKGLKKRTATKADSAVGDLALTVKPKKSTRKRLKTKRKLKRTLRLTYSPLGGAPATQKRKAVLRGKKRR